MKNKGFTLIEMLGVITLLAIIFALAYPNAMEMLDKGKKQDYVEFEKTVSLASEAYINSNSSLSMPNSGETLKIKISDLMSSGFLSTNVMNPKTKKTVSETPNAFIVVSKDSSGNITYSVGEG